MYILRQIDLRVILGLKKRTIKSSFQIFIT